MVGIIRNLIVDTVVVVVVEEGLKRGLGWSIKILRKSEAGYRPPCGRVSPRWGWSRRYSMGTGWSQAGGEP